MTADLERNLGRQPIANILERHELRGHDLVEASTEFLTHKMVARACKGRRLTRNVQTKVRNALNSCVEETYSLQDLFNY